MAIRYDELIPRLKRLLPPRLLGRIARDVQFIERLRAIRASRFVWAVVLSRFGSGIPGFAEARRWYERLGGARLWPRPFQMRFKQPEVVDLFEQAFEEAVEPWRTCRRGPRHPLARWFPDVVAWDSTLVQVADGLRPVFKGTRGAKASLKVALGISVFGRHRHDMLVFPRLEAFRKGTLWLFDKGFVAYDRLRDVDAAGQYFLCPMRLNGNAAIERIRLAPAKARRRLKVARSEVWLRTLLPRKKRIGRNWDLDVVVWPKTMARSRQQVRARLVIVPGPDGEQRPYLTNLPADRWNPAFLREAYRLRWQVELVFKELKQDLNLRAVPTKDRYAVQVFAWASLIALALSRAVSTWLQPLATLVGLAAEIRPALVTRALRGAVRFLAEALIASATRVATFLRLFAEDVLREARTGEREREDSFARLRALTPLRAAA
jgi:Transposase DDE domain